MPKIEKFKLPDGNLIDAEQININQTSEYWNQYFLEDGTVLKMKLVATKVVRLVGQYDQSGNPVYFVTSTNVVAVDSPDILKKK